ncbi:hypothetical protein DLAC_03954 [Tieghemostelium lacteum]|uniref:FNIP repeat-containing protein n=1 Tax=Tieghemostelium lacteum TaxID=361077 RepID=A0A151ZRV6_TIELA|nr:hypothetical protein DLAC_03954 [Tieghemostelium lacteum]|eukprot:KYQ96668.1 hypothetical protein DLAC_03954 [Tieghemostelium lacteum]
MNLLIINEIIHYLKLNDCNNITIYNLIRLNKRCYSLKYSIRWVQFPTRYFIRTIDHTIPMKYDRLIINNINQYNSLNTKKYLKILSAQLDVDKIVLEDNIDFDFSLFCHNSTSLLLKCRGSTPINISKLSDKLEHIVYSNHFNTQFDIPPLPSKLKTLVIGDGFNQPLNSSQFPLKLTRLSIGYQFNSPIDLKDLINLEYLKFGGYQFQQIIQRGQLPPNLKTLKFQYKFPLDEGILPDSITNLTMGYKHPINEIFLPKSLQTLVLNDYKNRIEFLPSGLRTLEIHSSNLTLNYHVLPENLEKLIIRSNTLYVEGLLPTGLKSLELRYNNTLNTPILLHLENLKSLEIEEIKNPINTDTLPIQLEILNLGIFNQILLPNSFANLKILKFNNFTQPIPEGVLPPTLERLYLGRLWNHPLEQNTFPPNLKKLKFSDSFDQALPYQLPNYIESLTFGDYFNQEVKNLPKYLRKLNLSGLKFNSEIVYIPVGLSILKLGPSFQKNFKPYSIPFTLELLYYHINYNYSDSKNIPSHVSYKKFPDEKRELNYHLYRFAHKYIYVDKCDDHGNVSKLLKFFSKNKDYKLFRMVYDANPEVVRKVQTFSLKSSKVESYKTMKFKDILLVGNLTCCLLIDLVSNLEGDGTCAIVEFLFSRGYYSSKLALVAAIKSQNIPILRLLSPRYQWLLKLNSSRILKFAVCKKLLSVVKFLFEELKLIPSVINSPLIYHAIQNNHFEMVQYLGDNNIGPTFKPYPERHVSIGASNLLYYDKSPKSAEKKLILGRIDSTIVSRGNIKKYTYYQQVFAIKDPRILNYLTKNYKQLFTWITVLNQVKLGHIENLQYLLDNFPKLFQHRSLSYGCLLKFRQPRSYEFLMKNDLYKSSTNIFQPIHEIRFLKIMYEELFRREVTNGRLKNYMQYHSQYIFDIPIDLIDLKTGIYILENYGLFKSSITLGNLFSVGLKHNNLEFLKSVFKFSDIFYGGEKTSKLFEFYDFYSISIRDNSEIIQLLLENLDRMGIRRRYKEETLYCSKKVYNYLLSQKPNDIYTIVDPITISISKTFKETKKAIGKSLSGKRIYQKPLKLSFQAKLDIKFTPNQIIDLVRLSISQGTNLIWSTRKAVEYLIIVKQMYTLQLMSEHVHLFSEKDEWVKVILILLSNDYEILVPKLSISEIGIVKQNLEDFIKFLKKFNLLDSIRTDFIIYQLISERFCDVPNLDAYLKNYFYDIWELVKDML